MKITEISFGVMRDNIKKNYKLMLIILIVCIFIGVITGLIFAHSYDPVKTTDIKQMQEHIDIKSLEKDEEYYYNAFFSLKEKYDYIKAYLEYFEQVDLSSESRDELDKIVGEIYDYQDEFEDAKMFFYENAPVPIDKVDSAVVFYDKKSKILEKRKEENLSELNEIVNGMYSNDYKAEQQKTLTEDISKIQNNIDMFTNHINIIENSTQSEIEQKAEEADLILDGNSEKLNNIIDDFNNTVQSISKRENYEIVYNKRLLKEYSEEAGFNNDLIQEDILANKKDQAIIYAKSIAGLDIKKERFLATLTFFVLFGVIISVIVGSVYMPKKGNS